MDRALEQNVIALRSIHRENLDFIRYLITIQTETTPANPAQLINMINALFDQNDTIVNNLNNFLCANQTTNASLNNNYPDATKDGGPTLINYDNDPKSIKGVGGMRYNKFVISPEIATSLISDGSDSFIISAKCINPLNNKGWSGGCHEGVGNIVITNGKGVVFKYNSYTPNAKDEVKELLKMNACGKGTAK